MARKITNQLLEMIEEGVLDSNLLVRACLCYMSEDEVADMAHHNGLLDEEDGESENEA